MRQILLQHDLTDYMKNHVTIVSREDTSEVSYAKELCYVVFLNELSYTFLIDDHDDLALLGQLNILLYPLRGKE
jgi:hypothetical protein